jgi:serine phosphatase RsbU (regulator of sigma subunit)
VTELASITDDPGLEALLAAASALAGGAVIAVAATPAPDGRSLPLRLDERMVGHVHYDAAVPDELVGLVCAALEMTLRGARQHASRARAAQELAIGRDIQRSLLPHHFPKVEGWRFAADYEPAREVGGDLYDVFRVRGSGRELALLIADVTGKGVPAALLMADTKALLHAAADNADDPADALARVNRILTVERRSSLFVTAALAEVDTGSGSLRLASAGHEPPVLVGEGGRVEQVQAGGPILGAFAGAAYQLQTCDVAPGESVVLYTDGITDTRDESGAFYGERRLLALLADLGGLEPDELLAAVLDDVRSFRGEAEVFDDLTILVARRER